MLADQTLETRMIKELVAQIPVAFETGADLSKRKVRMFDDRRRQQQRPARTAPLAFSASIVRLKRPKHVEKVLTKVLTIHVVHVHEVAAPDGLEAVDGTPLTTEPIEADEQISRVVDFYRARWLIEELFKALETGCAFEKRQLESMQTLDKAFALFQR